MQITDVLDPPHQVLKIRPHQRSPCEGLTKIGMVWRYWPKNGWVEFIQNHPESMILVPVGIPHFEHLFFLKKLDDSIPDLQRKHELLEQPLLVDPVAPLQDSFWIGCPTPNLYHRPCRLSDLSDWVMLAVERQKSHQKSHIEKARIPKLNCEDQPLTSKTPFSIRPATIPSTRLLKVSDIERKS